MSRVSTRKKKQAVVDYPRIKQLGLFVVNEPIPHVSRKQLMIVLKENEIEESFSKFFGQQTQIMEGPYASDVEDCLERVLSGKKQGGQHPLLWD